MNKTGFHVQLNNRNPNYDERTMALKPPGMTFVCDQSMLWYIMTFKNRSPDTRYFLRTVEGENERKRAVGVADAETEALAYARFCDEYIPKKIKNEKGELVDNPNAPLRDVCYFQPYDEIGGPSTDPQTKKNLQWIAQFTKYAVPEFKRRGIKLAAINLSEGCPPIPPYDPYNGWDELLPGIQAINEVGPQVAIVQLHTYGFNKGMFDSKETHLLRFMSLINYIEANNLLNVYIAFGEAGKDSPSFADSYNYYTPDGYDTRPDDMTGYTAYANDWIAFDKLIVQLPRVLWACWYTLDMLEDGYWVADQVRQVGNKIVEMYPLFSIVEKHCQDNRPMYLIVLLGEPTAPPPPVDTDLPKKAHTITEVYIRSTPEYKADLSNVTTVLAADAPFVGVKRMNANYQECQIGPAIVGYITTDPRWVKYD